MYPQEEDLHPYDEGCTDGLLALKKNPKTDTMSCTDCPYPFCVRDEANRIRNMARDVSIMAMLTMNASVKAIAEKTGMEVRTVYDVAWKNRVVKGCYWCKLNYKPGGVFCRTNIATVTYDNDTIAVTLIEHRIATLNEYSFVDTLVEGMFPDGVLQNHSESPHSHWVINRVSGDEARHVYDRMKELSVYTSRLR